MSWADTIKENAGAASRDSVPADANAICGATSTSWDPYEVWLSRVKLPRDLAASRLSADAENHVRRLQAVLAACQVPLAVERTEVSPASPEHGRPLALANCDGIKRRERPPVPRGDPIPA